MVREVSPSHARERQRAGATLIDVREEHERALGMARGARGIAKAAFDAAPGLPHDTEILVICAKGGRSLDSAHRLLDAGYTNVASVAGGTDAWRAADLPMTDGGADPDFLERYSRHLLLPQVGLAG